jgi:hypothetical protein
MVELVPPNPKELDRKILIFFEIVSQIILSLAEASSGVSKLILGAINEWCIISME